MADSTTTTTTSKQFTINWADAGKGLLMAVITSVLTVIYETVQAGTLTFDWKKIGIVATTSAVGYLIKNFFTPSATVTKTT